MRANWDKLTWWVIFVAMLYVLAVLFMSSCSSRKVTVFENGDRIIPRDVVEPDMARPEKDQ